MERQLLMLLSLFACAALTPLTAIALDLVQVPFWILTLTVTLAFAATTVLMIRLLRRRFALLSRLEQLTRHIIRGDYAHRVEVRAQDEFQSLGNAFNEMTDQLQASLKSSQSVADIDRLILSSADLETVVRKVLLSARMEAVDISLLLRIDARNHRLVRFRLDEQQLIEEPIKLKEASDDTLRDVDGYTRVASRLSGVTLRSCLAVAADGIITGALIAAADRSLTAAEANQLTDLAGRLSVAITNIQRSEVLFQKAHFDELTGLINRHAFQENLREHISRSWRGETGAVLFIDLDGFKKVNDTEGHKAGDRLLVIIADRLKACLREVDTIARMGGDEFAVIVPGCEDEKTISHLCERIIGSAIQPVVVDRMEHTVGASIGVALFPDDGQKVDELIMKADSAMYRAKEAGRSRFAFFDDSLNEANRHRVLVESRLRTALARDELTLHFQPKLNLADHTVTSAEALLRWSDEVLGSVRPEVFVPIAEETNLIHDFTAVQVNRTADLIAAADAAGVRLDTVAINASAKQLMSEGFAMSLLSMLDRRLLPHDKIEIEVTESVFAHDKRTVVQELEILQAAGIKIALDDFGTGFSSLNMLRELPLDVVKIDRSFITEVDTSDQARVLVQHLISIASTLGKEVVAEGVETEVQLKHLEDASCHYVQGFLVSEALSTEAFLQLLSDWQSEDTRPQLHLV
ncbi:MAG TPA: EAL domain-containing protein [Pseudomonadales bacterium]